jgi:O-antigen biosynthesis protein WbqP
VKRLFDLTLALLAIIPAAVICLLVLPMIWIDCRASPLFLQKRIGQHRRIFRILKLRTMKANTPNVASHEANSAQITRSGAWLRRFKIDELPQIWNVLTGDMSFVGPRPCLPNQLLLIEEREQRGVFNLRPGITGIAQIAGFDMSMPAALAERDSDYLSPWSLTKDCVILWHTLTGAGSGDAAVASRR